MAAPTTAMSMIAEEIRSQADAVLKDAAEVTPIMTAIDVTIDALSEHPGPRALLTHSGCRVTYTEQERTQADNESDLVGYTYELLIWTSGEDQGDMGQALESWSERIAELLGDAASSRSMLRTVPLPLSGLTIPNAVVWDIQVGTSVPGVVPYSDDGAFRLARNLTVVVTCYRERSRP